MKNCILIHLYYSDLWKEFKPLIIPILDQGLADLFITYNSMDESIEDAIKFSKFSFAVENKGLDAGAFVYFLSQIDFNSYSTITKIHTKKSIHHGREIDFGEKWRKNLYLPLIETPETFNKNIETLISNPGILGSRKYFLSPEEDHNNFVISDLEKKIDRLEIILKRKFEKTGFFAGSIYMVSPEYLELLFERVNLMDLHSRFENGYKTGNLLAHAFERVIGYGIEKFNYRFNFV